MPAGGGPPVIHRHEYAEVFYILEGEFEITTVSPEGEAHPVGRVAPGDSVAIPSWAWHNFRNVGGVPGRLFAVHSGVRMEEFAREVGVAVEDPAGAPAPATLLPEQRERLMAAVGRYMDVWTPGAPPPPTPGT